MGHWTKVSAPIDFVPRAGPAKMNRDFAPLVFTDAQGEAQSNAEWNYQDANGKALFDADVPLKYWTPDGAGSVREMNAAEKTAADAAIDAQTVTEVKADAVAHVDVPREEGDLDALEIRALIQNANRRINYLTNRVEEVFATMEAMRLSTGNVNNLRAVIPVEHPNQDATNPLVTPANFSLIQTRGLGAAIQDYKDDINNDQTEP